MGFVESSRSPERVRGVERSFEVQLGSLGGFDLRPTRFFIWGGSTREGREQVLPLGTAPRNLQIPRRPRELKAGAVTVRSLGSPLMTIALAGVNAVRKARRSL
ncbi:MAG: hypothetical protein ACRDM8_05880 [Gaiellaceae bacterium]|jgi:hypothetical protein